MVHLHIERRRGCGWRKKGGLYAVGPGMSVGGDIPVRCEFAALDEYIAVPEGFGNRRGYVYINGDALEARVDPSYWIISAKLAEAWRWIWLTWGCTYGERSELGPRADTFEERTKLLSDTLHLIGTADVHGLSIAVRNKVELMRKRRECAMVPAVLCSHQLVKAAEHLDGNLLHPLSTAWRTASAVAWGMGQSCPKTNELLGKIMVQLCAVSDAAYLRERIRPPRQVADILMWIGAQYYPTPNSFICEARAMGASKRLPSLPRGAVPGVTRIWLVHPKAIDGTEPGVIGYYYLAQLQQVVANVDDAILPELEAMGVKAVAVQREEEGDEPTNNDL